MEREALSLSIPKTPSNEQLCRLAGELFADSRQKSLCFLLCLCVMLAVAPDGERNIESVEFYLSELAKENGVSDMTVTALGMWLTGTIPTQAENESFEMILSCFRGAYMFPWQKRLAMLAIDTRNELVCYDDFREYALQAENELSKRGDKDLILSQLLQR